MPRKQLIGGTVGGAVAGVVLIAALRLHQGGELFASAHMTLLRAGIGVCLVALGLWTLRRAAPGRR